MYRALILALFILATLILSTFSIEMKIRLLHDPPSIYNRDRGGITEFIAYLKARGYRVHVIESLCEAYSYDAKESIVFVLSPDKTIDRDEVRCILRWVSRGGKLVVMDELNNTVVLANALGIKLGGLYIDIDVATCIVGKERMSLLIDVYRYVYGGDPLCIHRDRPIGIVKKLGLGEVVFFGDSSLIINAVLTTRYRTLQLYAIKKLVLDRHTIVVYEGGRAFEYTRFNPLMLVIAIPISFVSAISGSILALDLVKKLIALAIIIVSICAIAVPLFTKEKVYIRLTVSRFKPKKSTIDKLRDEIKKGVRKWLYEV